MKTLLILKPGQRGTKGLTDKYGKDLVCVRFRYDAEKQQRIKTVELIDERTEWTPPPPRFSADTLVPMRIAVADRHVRLRPECSVSHRSDIPVSLFAKAPATSLDQNRIECFWQRKDPL